MQRINDLGLVATAINGFGIYSGKIVYSLSYSLLLPTAFSFILSL